MAVTIVVTLGDVDNRTRPPRLPGHDQVQDQVQESGHQWIAATIGPPIFVLFASELTLRHVQYDHFYRSPRHPA
jgi:hypothetical protein